MKKFISIVLTICMIFSLITVTTAAEISEEDRLALLKEKDYTFIDINPNIDAFASIDVIRDYAPFYSVESADSSTAYNAVHDAGSYTYMTRIPSFTHAGEPITGNESYYKKGIGYFNIGDVRVHSVQKHSPLMFVTESFTLNADEFRGYKYNKYASVGSTTTAKMFAANPDGFALTKVGFANDDNGYNFMPLVDEREYFGSDYNVILKDNNSDVKVKIGPMNDEEFVPNAVDYVGGGKSPNHIVTVPEGVKGDSIAIAATTANVNNGGSVPEITLTPAAALLPIQIAYADGDVETKYMVITSLTNANDMVNSAIVYGDKYDDNGGEIDYSTEKDYYSQLQFIPKGSGLTFADVTFPENVSAGDLNFGFALRANQHDTSTDFSNMINLGTFPLKDKEIKTIKYVNDQAPGDNKIEGIISLKSKTGTANIRALVPVEIKNGDADKVYFLYVGRIVQQPAVFATTVINKSLQEKIDEINAKLELVNENTTEDECKAINKEIQALKAKSEYVIKDSDFIEEKYQIVKDVANSIYKEDIIKVTEKITALKDVPYSAAMKAEIEAIVAAVKSIEERGGELPTDAQDILKRLLAQKDETAYYVTTKLNYTRDIFEDVKKYAAQGYADKENKVYVYPLDAWQPTVSAVAGTNKFAVDEEDFVVKLGVDSNNYVEKNGIPYQFGPIRSVVHGVNNEPNSINAADCSNTIEIDVEQLPYEEFYLAGWSRNNGAENTAVITYIYTDGSTSTEMNIKVFKGGTLKPTLDEYTEFLNNDLNQGILYWRAYSSTAAADQTHGYGGYRIFIVSHRLTPDDTKTLKSIKIQPSNQDLNILALTGKVSNSGILNKILIDNVENFEDMKEHILLESIKTSTNIMNALDEKGIAYKEGYREKVEQFKEVVKQQYVSAFEECVKALSEKYISDEKEMLFNAQDYYSGIIALGIPTDFIDEDLLNKYNFLLAEYDTCVKLEEQITAWNGEYIYSMYEEVLKVKEELDKLAEKALSPEIKAQFEKMYSWAIRAKGIDERIAVLPDSYSEENKEEIIALMDEMQVLYDEGCMADSFANRKKLLDLYSNTGMCGESTTWSLNEDGVLTVSGTGAMRNFRYVNDTPWYSAKDNITKVVIDNEVTNVGRASFYGFTGIEEVQIGTGVKEIVNGAFGDCTGIVNIEIPANVEKICQRAFCGCNSLAIVELTEGLKEIGTEAFAGCTPLVKINIPKTVEKIGSYAFSQCASLKTIEIPEWVKTIKEATFSGCQNLSTILLPKNLKEINKGAFSGCKKLKKIVLPENIESIAEGAFNQCTSLEEIVIPDNVTTIGKRAFYSCSSLEEIIIPDSVTTIGEYAFYSCSSLEEIIIPDSVTTIEGHAFFRCTGLKNLTMSRNVKFIGESAFYNCGLETVSYKNSEKDWAQIEIGLGNSSLSLAQKIFVKNILPEIVANDLTTIVKAKLYNTDSLQGVMMAVGYNKDSISKIKNTAVTTEGTSVDMEGKYEKIKVLAWESLANLKPICNAETVE